MQKIYVLYNPISGNGTGEISAHALEKFFPEETLIYTDIYKLGGYKKFFASLAMDDKVVLCGGDGTLNRFINSVSEDDIKNEVLYYGMGSGNDFLRDVGKEPGSEPFPLNPYIKNLPTVCIKGKTYRFLNNVGFGIDGYCCEVGDEQREAKKEKINYTAIAIKGLLFNYRTTNATVTVDGNEYKYKNVWLAPTMKGRFYGGGMMPTPEQDRSTNTLSLMLMHKSGKLRTLMIFPSIFKGEHVKHDKFVSTHTGSEITVRFDSPRAVQIDGETIKNVTEYTVTAAKA